MFEVKTTHAQDIFSRVWCCSFRSYFPCEQLIYSIYYFAFFAIAKRPTLSRIYSLFGYDFHVIDVTKFHDKFSQEAFDKKRKICLEHLSYLINCLLIFVLFYLDSGVNCTYYYPQFSKSCSWVTLMCQGPFVPVTHMVSTRNDQQYALTYNNQTKKILAEKDVPVNVYYTVESDGFQIPVRETRPKNFDESKKYAVLFDV